eukprot:TRINITY_DN14343_c0_g1_i3.p1 TRINITY_DN14343_c0_g1~~TRINITY_DN14343_c0_g1_i3.p1  ORF type:complete len:448 (-),score=71.28 TRINITY_DN14343_c0_g1_i3:313-1656(-)
MLAIYHWCGGFARYCCSECQKGDWRRHRAECKALLSASRQVSEEPQVDDPLHPSEWITVFNGDVVPEGSEFSSPAIGCTNLVKECLARDCGGFVSHAESGSFLLRRTTAALVPRIEYARGWSLLFPAAAARTGGWRRTHVPPVSIDETAALPKLSGVSPDVVRQRLAQSVPVVLLDFQSSWNAKRTWTFELLEQRWASEMLIASDLAPFFRGHDESTIRTIRVSMREFTRYVCGEPNALSALQRDENRPFYANGWVPSTECQAAVFEDLASGESIIEELPVGKDLTKIFIGPAGTVTRLHHDTYGMHVWLSQVRGRKQFICYPPEDASLLGCEEEDVCGGRTSLFDPSAPDYEAFPKAWHARAYNIVLEEGETVILPSKWLHWAKSLTPSITVMRNFVNETNLRAFTKAMQKRHLATSANRLQDHLHERERDASCSPSSSVGGGPSK